ncbi:MAG: TraR/DksA C4-type zinc finger protein [Phycisphaerales bacterium]|nr:TraR/DksA C4-type zinc finger protein [Phycisphaerales bacterium]
MAKKSPPKKMTKAAAPKKKAAAVKKSAVVAPKKAASVTKAASTAKAKSKPKIVRQIVTKSRLPESPAKKASVKTPVKVPVKASASLGKADLQYFRHLLLEKRREILGDVGSMESEAFKGGSNLSNMPIHMADVGTDNFEQEFTLGLIESERKILREIQDALIRIDNNTFGICQGTGKPIPRVRLEAVPWAKYRIEYSRLLESGKIARDEEGASEEEAGGDEDEE